MPLSSCRPKLNSKSFFFFSKNDKVSSNARTTITNFLRSHLLPARSNRSKARFEKNVSSNLLWRVLLQSFLCSYRARMIKSYSTNFISVSQDFFAERSPLFCVLISFHFSCDCKKTPSDPSGIEKRLMHKNILNIWREKKRSNYKKSLYKLKDLSLRAVSVEKFY